MGTPQCLQECSTAGWSLLAQYEHSSKHLEHTYKYNTITNTERNKHIFPSLIV